MPNAIERRLSALDELWDSAVREQVRLVRWRPVDADHALVRLHIRMQTDEGGLVPDLVLLLDRAPDPPADYATGLAGDLRAMMADLPGEGALPAPGAGLTEVTTAILARFGTRFRFLVLALMPAGLTDPAGWRAALEPLLTTDMPKRLRLVVVDPAETPMLDGLDDAHEMTTVDPALDMASAMDELARSEGEPGTGRDFRIQFVAIGTAAARGNLGAAARAARQAARIAKREGWPDQEVAAHLSYGAALIGAGRPREALRIYRLAYAACHSDQAARHPAIAKLKPIVLLSEGGALVAAGDLEAATVPYWSGARLAEEVEDHFLALEGWRMAGYCYEQSGEVKDAWRCNEAALGAVERLPRDARATTTAPYVGQAMLRLLEGHKKAALHRQQVNRRMIELIGKAWDGPVSEPAS